MILRAVILQTILSPGSDQCERLLICPAFVFLGNAMQRKMQARLASLPRTQASFIEPMECLSVSKLPAGLGWIWEIKLDGYRALAVKSPTGVTLFSRNRKSLNRQFPYIVEALADLPEGMVVDGEVVAIDDSGRPNFNLLQNFRAEASRIQYYVFDLLCWKDRDLTRLPLIERRMLLKALLVVNDSASLRFRNQDLHGSSGKILFESPLLKLEFPFSFIERRISLSAANKDWA